MTITHYWIYWTKAGYGATDGRFGPFMSRQQAEQTLTGVAQKPHVGGAWISDEKVEVDDDDTD